MEWVEYMTSDASSPMANLRRANGRDKPWKVRYIAVGNESWGCGGSMRPEFYADNFRRYTTFIKDYQPGPENRIYKVACGPSEADYAWTDTVMKIAGGQMDGLSLHYYTIPQGDWSHKGSATQFGRDEYYSTLGNTLRMEQLIRGHAAIMDKYDPKKRVGLAVDEWASSSSRTPCATRCSPPSTCTSSRRTPTGSSWPTSPRW
jgi:alpha-N-arabinofuranosidase